MIQNFSCKNFRNIAADNLSFEKINILIGPNNSGKTNFIRALTFFAEMLDRADEGKLKSSFLNAVARNGWEHMLNKDAREDKEIRFTWKLNLNGAPVEYIFACTVGNTIEDCNIVLEEMNSATENDISTYKADIVKCGHFFRPLYYELIDFQDDNSEVTE